MRSKLWMTTERLPEQTGLPSPLCRPWILQLWTQHLTHHIFSVTATNHRTDHLRLFLLALCVQDSLNRFCWCASQTVDEWTGRCVSGVAVGTPPQQGCLWAAHVHCAVIPPPISQKVCWDLPIAIYFLLSFFSFCLIFLFLLFPRPTPQTGKGSDWCNHEES